MTNALVTAVPVAKPIHTPVIPSPLPALSQTPTGAPTSQYPASVKIIGIRVSF
jgi:hypothetical protein